MKKLFLMLIAATGLAFLSGCKDQTTDPSDATPSYPATIQFKGTYNGEQVVKYKKYPFGTSNYPIYFNRFRTYLSDVYLVNGNKKVLFAEVLDVDFFPDTAPGTMSLTPEFKANIPEGTYTGIRFGIGVKANLNSKLPTDYPVGHPLRNEIEYWPGWKSFIFSKLEATSDGNNDGTDDNWMQYHTGADPVYVEYQIDQPITVSNNAGKIVVSFDIKRMLTKEDGTYYDIVANSVTSSNANDLVVSLYIANSFNRSTQVVQQ